MSPVNWDEFRDGDPVRVTIEGTYRSESDDMSQQVILDNDARLYLYPEAKGIGTQITSAELIARPFTPPAPGKLFRAGMGQLCISLGDHFRIVRTNGGKVSGWPGLSYPFQKETHEWRDSIEVLDI